MSPSTSLRPRRPYRPVRLPRRRRAAAGVLVAALALGLGACTAGSGASSGGSGAEAVAPGAPAAPEGFAAATSAPADAGSGSGPAATGGPVAGDKLVRTAALQVEVADVEAGAAQARQVATAAGGTVVAEDSSAAPVGQGTVDKSRSRSSLTLSVPADALDRVLDDLARLGTAVQRSSTARDVTATYVDTRSRVTTMAAAVDRLRSLLAKATDLGQVVTLETEVSKRQADLDALQAQLASLESRVAASTVTLTLVTAAAAAVVEPEAGGFLGGLSRGWQAFLTTGGGVLTVVGALLPFLLLAALVVAPVWWWRRRKTSGGNFQSDPAAGSEPPDDGSGGGPVRGTGPHAPETVETH